MAMFDPSIPGGFKTPPIGGEALAGAGTLGSLGSALSAATLPISFVNLMAGLFGRKSSFPKHLARSITRESGSIFKRQLSILEKAGGARSDIYGRLKEGQSELNKLTKSGNIQGIIGVRQGLIDLFGSAQDIISPIPEDFKFSAKEYDPRRAGSSRLGKGAAPFKTTEQFFRINQFLDKLQGKGQVLTRITGRTKGFRSKPIVETLGQGYFVDAPVPEVIGGGRARRQRIQGLAKQQKRFIQIKPLDIEGLRGRLGTTAPVTSEVSQPQGVDKKQIGEVAIKAARSFLRFPRSPARAFRSSGFVSRAGYRDISELEQDVDRIIPSGFISKQPTTQSRALALRSLS